MAKKIKKAQDGLSLLNPKNWGVTDLTKIGSFNKAFEFAKKNNAEQFMWNGKRYNTKSDLTPKQQLDRYGIIDEQRLPQTGLRGRTRTKLADNLYPPATYSGTERTEEGEDVDNAVYKRVFNAGILNEKEELRKQFDKRQNRIRLDKNESLYIDDQFFRNQVDFSNLYFGKPQKYGNAKISEYKPTIAKDKNKTYYTSDAIKQSLSYITDDIANAFINSPRKGIMPEFGGFTGDFKLSKGKDEKGEYLSFYDKWDLAPTGDRYGEDESRGLGKPFEIYDRIYLADRDKMIKERETLEKGEFKQGGKIMKNNKLSKSKAAEMLHNPPHGKKLTDKQRKFFAATAYGQQGLSIINPNSYTSSIPNAAAQPIVNTTSMTGTPTFPTKKHHDTHYRNRMVRQMQQSHPELHQRYVQLMAEGNSVDADAMIMAAGGIPKFTPPASSSVPITRSRILDIDYKPKKAKGYRYETGPGKPDVESITSYKKGGIIKDNMGQLKHPGKITQIDSNNITMKGVPYPVLGISDTNDTQLMLPNEDYKFDGSIVTEYPMTEGFHKMPDGSIMSNAEMAKSGIHIKKENRGLLHKNLGVPQGEKIPASKLKIKSTDSPAVKKRKQFAINAKKWKHEDGGSIPEYQLGGSLQNQLSEIQLKTALLNERKFKRDSVRQSLIEQYPNAIQNPMVVQGMLDYYKTEPKEYMSLDTKMLDDKRKKELTQKFGKKYQYGTQNGELPSYTQESFDPMYNSNINPYQPQAQTKPKSNFLNNMGGMQGIVQGIGAAGMAYQGNANNSEQGGPSGAQRIVGGFGPWGAAISQVSQIGTGITDKSSNPMTGAIGTTIFDPASAWTNKDLSKTDRIIGGLIPMYGGYKATQARNEKKRKAKELERIVQEASVSRDMPTRRYVRPEDQIFNPEELSPSYGTGTSYLKKGGVIRYMDNGGELETHWGGKAQIASENPYLPGAGETIEFKGNSHADGGIGVKFGKSNIEVEGGEPAVKLPDGKDESLVVFGDMKIPSYGVSELMDPKAKGKKFKNYVNDLNKIENKQNEIVEKGVKLVNDTPVLDSFDKLKVASGKAMIEGGNMKLKEIAAKKQIAANVQNAILETAEELNLKSDDLAKGKFKKAKYGTKMKAQEGGIYEKYIDPVEAAVLRDQLAGTTPAMNPGWGNYGIYYGTPSTGNTGSKHPIVQKRTNTPSSRTSPRNIRLDYTNDNLPIQGDINTDYFKNVPPYEEIPELFVDSTKDSTGTSSSRETDIQGTPSGQNQFDWMSLANSILPYFRPTNQRPLDPNQLAGERYALATNQLEPVQAQTYQPLLENVSDISLQDQLNANQADFNALQRYTAQNPAAQAALAAQKYQANSQVLGEQFRQNQAQRMGVYNRNRGVLNDATLKNLAILDQQYVRQSQAKSNTKAVAQQAINSISDKIARNKLENRTLGVYENLYNYRYDNQGRAINWNGFAQFNVDNGIIDVDENGKVVLNENKVKRDKYGIVTESTQTSKEQQRRQYNKTTKSNKNGGIVKALKGY